MEGVTIKKPAVYIRRSLNSSLPFSNLSYINGRGDNSGESSHSTAFKQLHRAASVYSQKVVNKAPKTNVATNTSLTVPSQTADKLLPNRSSTVKTPVKVKMQTTIKRLNNEASHTPNKPNAFNLSKCSKPPHSQSAATNQNELKSQTGNNNLSKFRRNLYSVKVPDEESLREPKNLNSPGHFVSSSQAKAASSMGIMHFGTAYSSVVAAANRGCLNGKYFNPHPPTQVIVPKNFPTSVLNRGAVLAGGNTMGHPSTPPGVVAVRPQNLGLSLPFGKCFNPELSSHRGNAYSPPDSRFGPSYVRVSGIYEWLNKQQHESGLIVSSYFSFNKNNDFLTSSGFDAGEQSLQLTKGELAVPTDISNALWSTKQKKEKNLSDIHNAMQRGCSVRSVYPGLHEIDSFDKFDNNGPFVNKLSSKKNSIVSSTKSFKKPKWEEVIAKNAKVCRRRFTESFVRRSFTNHSSIPFLRLYSLSHRRYRSAPKNERLDLTISCPSV